MEAVFFSETSQITLLMLLSKPKMPPYQHALAGHVCAQCTTVGSAVHKTLSVLDVGL
jgi:hypothetical protein